jgi:DNA polymerase-3 subunit delta
MWIKAEQLTSALTPPLAPLYFISGDEPLQIGEAADAIRLVAKQAGYANREVLTVDSHFKWAEFSQSADSLSIFSDKKIIDLRIPSGKPGIEGSKALVNYCQRLPEDTLLLISSGKLEKSAKNSKWAKILATTGIALQIWPLEGELLLQWLQKRLHNKGLIADKQDIQLLATHVEGNLLAAAQEIEKLFVLYGSCQLSRTQITHAVTDSSRYDVFNLVDAALSGRLDRAGKILNSLKHEGIAPPVVLWALTRETRHLISIQQQLADGEARNNVFMRHQVWDKRQKLVSFALNQLKPDDLMQILLLAAKTDRQIKGEESGNSWHSLLHIICLLANKPAPFTIA